MTKLFIPAPRDRKGRLAWINANERTHWAVRAEKTKAWRTAAWAHARHQQLPQGMDRAHITVYVHKTNKRSYDAGNLSPTAKAIVDGLVTDYGLLPDDNNDYLEGPDLRRGEVRDQAGVTVTIRNLTDGP